MKKCCHFSTTNTTSYNALLIVLLIAATGALLQIGGGCWDVVSYIKSLPESFFTSSYTVVYSGVIIID